MVFNGTGLDIKLQDPLGTLCSESECRSSVFRLKTTESAPLIHCACSSTLGSCTVVTSLHVITTGLPNQLSIFSMVIPISSSKIPTANLAKKVVSLRACNLLGSMFVHPVISPFATSSFQKACGKISFPSINMHIINVVFSSISIALQFILAMASFRYTQLLLGRSGIICMPLTITYNYYCIMINEMIVL